MTGLYVHVPFCRKKCHYCNFVITLSSGGAKETRFLELFEKEINHRAPALSRRRFGTLYVGGGTPSVLTEEELTRLFSALRRSFTFEENAEVTLEVNPGDVTPPKAELLKKLGVNRVSLGAQSFHDKTLSYINRTHRAETIESSYRILRSAGLTNISVDLMLSLPGETSEDLAHSLAQIRRLDPEHVSIYEMVVEEKTVFARRAENGTLPQTAEENQIRMLSDARVFLEAHGWAQYELLNYAKKGMESAHNRLYWRNEEYLGLGPGAYSYVDGTRFRYAASFDEYLQKAAAGDWSNREEERLGAREREAESFLLALRTSEGVELEKFASHLRSVRMTADEYVEKGFLEKTRTHLKLSGRGKFFAETIFSGLSLPD